MAENNNNTVVDRDSLLNAPKFYKQPDTKSIELQFESSESQLKVVESQFKSTTKISSSSSTSISQSSSIKQQQSTETILEIQD